MGARLQQKLEEQTELCRKCDYTKTSHGYVAEGRWLFVCQTCEPEPCKCCDGPNDTLCQGCPNLTAGQREQAGRKGGAP